MNDILFGNNNGPILKKLTKRSLKANKRRNFFLVMAIMLTTLLIGSVFSVGMSLVESVKMEQIRFAGTMAHAAVGHPTAEQIKRLHTLDYVKEVGTGNSVGVVQNTANMGNIRLTLHYFDKTEWEELRAPAYVDIVGNYPEKENEIMVSRGVLERMGFDTPSIGMEIPLTYRTDSENGDSMSGWFTSYAFVQSTETADVIFVSHALSQRYGKTVEKDGSASIQFADESRVSEIFAEKTFFLLIGNNWKKEIVSSCKRFFQYANQFIKADEILIAAPYWDLAFPSVLRVYFEHITITGLTFQYSPEGIPTGLCNANRLIYVTTSGGPFGNQTYGYGYIKELANSFYGIPNDLCFKAENLDIKGADVNGIMQKVMKEIENADI